MLSMLLPLACTSPPEPAVVVPDEEEPQVFDTQPVEVVEAASCEASVELGSVEGLVRWPYLQLGTPDGMTVLWGGPVDSEAAELGWGRTDTAWAVEATRTVIEGMNGDFRLFQARAEGLQPGTEYCYRVVVDGVVLAEGLRFKSAPDSTNAPLKFLVIGDFGAGTPEQYAIHDRMLEHVEGAELLITTGDNAYNSGTWAEVDEFVFGVNRDILHRVVTYPTAGNHDYGTDQGAPYLANWVLPENAWRFGDKERYYSVGWGPLLLLALDTERPLGEVSSEATDDQLDWLQAQLEAIDRPWVVPAFHKPGVEGHATRGPDIFVLSYFVPLFEQYGLRLVLTGHNHHYERFRPLGEQATVEVPKGVTYVVTGGGGRGLYDLDPEEPRRAVGLRQHHFLVGQATTCSLDLTAINIDGEVIDQFGLRRCQ